MSTKITSWFGLLILLCSGHASWAQDDLDAPYAILKMVDGSKYIGQVVDDDRRSVSLCIITGDTIQARRSLIKKYMSSDDYFIMPSGKYHKTRGLYWQLGTGFNVISDGNEVSNGFFAELGYLLNEDWGLGLGVSSEFHDVNTSGFTISASTNVYYVKGKYFLTEAKRRVYAIGRVGFAENTGNNFRSDTEAGLNLQYGLGIQFGSRRKGRFFLTLQMMHQDLSGRDFFIDQFGNEVNTRYDIWLNRPFVTFGVVFN